MHLHAGLAGWRSCFGWGDEYWRGWGFETTVPYDASLCADGDHELCCSASMTFVVGSGSPNEATALLDARQKAEKAS